MHKISEIILALLRKSAGALSASLIIISVPAVSALAQQSSTDAVKSNTLPKNTVVATITVGSNPNGLVVSPDSSTVYVVDIVSKEVSVIDAATNTVKTTIPVGSIPQFAAITPDGKTLYVTNFGDGTVSVISTASNTVTSTVTVGGEPDGAAVSPDGSEVFVANSSFQAVQVIATATNQVSSINVPGYPFLISFTPDGKQAYVMNTGGTGFISVIDVATKTLTKKILGGGEIFEPQGIAVSPNGATLYVSDVYNYVAAIDVVSGALKKAVLTVPLADIGLSYGLGQPVVTPNGSYVYVAANANNNVVMLTTSTNKRAGQPIPTGHGPSYMAVAPNGTRLYVTNNFDNTVTVVDIVSL